LSKPFTSRGWVCAFCIVPALAIVATALLVLSPARHRSTTGTASAASFASQPGTVTRAARGRVQANYAALPLAFEQNQGQTDARVKYVARGNGYTLFLTADEAVFSLYSRSAQSESSSVRRAPQVSSRSLRKHSAEKDSAVVRMQLVGGNSLAKVSASGQLPGKSNYFLGNDPGKWRSDVAHYARVSYQDVYPGVNLAFHGAQRQTEFDFVVAPGANPAPIGFHFTGAQGMKTDDSGNLVISSTAGDVLLHKPVAYQELNGARQAVDARFVLRANHQVSFELGNYDRSRELVIDPSVSYAYSTYLGGSGNDEGQGIAFDSTGAAYVTGQTASANFPGASNSLSGTANAFVTKIAPDGSSLDYSTYIGGTGSTGDSGNAIAVNETSGVAYVAGGTSSTNFPFTAGAFQKTLNGTTNAFVCELGPTGTRTYCTYLGGSGIDAALGIALATDSSGDVYAVGKTSSTDFPTLSPLPNQAAGGFVTRLNSSGSALVYSTYLGAAAGDFANAVAVDSSGKVYVAGQTSSSSFYATPGAFQTANGGLYDAFVTVINAAGNGYVYSTFLGGSGNDEAYGIAVDSLGDAYVTGATISTDFPVKSALQSYGGNTDAFVTKLNPSGSALVYSTYLGGGQFDSGGSIAVDGSNNAYVTGQTDSTAPTPFPTVGATQSTLGGGFDAFVSEINSTGSALIFSTYLGGSGVEDNGNLGAIAVDSAGANIYVTGNTASTNFPTHGTPPYTGGNANGGLADAFVVKYTQSSAAPTFSLSATALTPASGSPGVSATSTVSVSPTTGFSGSVTLTCAITPAVTLGPTCGAASATPAAPATLTVSTTPATALLRHPMNDRSSGMFYAMFMPIGGIALLGFGSTGSRRKKLFGFLFLSLMFSGLILMPACGGGGGGHTGNPGTPAGTYTITVSGTATGATQTGASPALTLTVN
jgi:hypothetical protein